VRHLGNGAPADHAYSETLAGSRAPTGGHETSS
jgi:hypothetical protein